MSEQEMTLAQGSAEMEGKYLTFWVDGQLFGMTIAAVEQIISVCPITEVPEYPSFIKGLIQLRGGVIPVMDIRLRLQKADRAYDDKTCIIVTLVHEQMIGLIVDQVDAVTTMEDDQISPPPELAEVRSGGGYLIGIGRQDGKTVLLLDCQRIVPEGVVFHHAEFTQ